MTPTISPELQEQIEREAEAEYQKSDYYKPLGQTMWIKAAVIAATPWAAKFQDSERRRNEANALLFPLLDYGQSKEANIPLGQAVTTVILQRAKRFEEARKVLENLINTRYTDDFFGTHMSNAKALIASWKEEGKEGGI